MTQPLNKLKEYYQLTLTRLRKSSFSPNQTKVYEQILKLFDSATDPQSFQAQKDQQNLDFQLAKAIAVDNWLAKAVAAKERDDEVSAHGYQAIAEAAGKTQTLSDLSAVILAEQDKVVKAQKVQEDIKYNLTGAIYALYEYSNCHLGDQKVRQKLALDFKDNEAKLAKNGQKIDSLMTRQYFRALFPFSEAVWQKLLQALVAVRANKREARTEEELKAAQAAIINELKKIESEMSRVQQEINKRQKRKLFLGIASADRPGPYRFEPIWEGPA